MHVSAREEAGRAICEATIPEQVDCREWLALAVLWRREIELARPFSTQMVQSMPRVVPEEQSLEPAMRAIGRPCVHGLAVWP